MVQPLKDEIVALQLESDKATEEMSVIEEQIDDLQRSIAGYEHTTAVTIATTIFPSAAPHLLQRPVTAACNAIRFQEISPCGCCKATALCPVCVRASHRRRTAREPQGIQIEQRFCEVEPV